jgi:flagellar biosynthesis protein
MKDLDEIKAIALEYGRREAPSIVAKGEGETAMSIIDAAFDLGLPVIEDEALQKLLMGVEIGDEIPESLYRAVAVVLAWVFWLRGDEPRGS